ncbi:MAG: SpoIID/LytB domain-containing protein [Acidimicrobiales bacterium]
MSKHLSATSLGGRPLAMTFAAVIFASAVTVALLAPLGGPRGEAAAAAVNPFPNGIVTIDGHGYGPGIGMGQWGAYGYAAKYHEKYAWILSHFYGGTTAGHSTDIGIRVAILENENAPVVVTSGWHFRFGGYTFAGGQVAKAVLSSATKTWQISTSTSCSASSWTRVRSGLIDPQAVPASQKATAPAAQLLTLCRADGVHETVRGLIRAVNFDNAETGNRPLERTINVVPIEEYVADVVPSESSSGWGLTGGAGPQAEQWGFQSLEAQAVAARTYTLDYMAAGGWPSGSGKGLSYADICDSTYCQSYPGILNESTVGTRSATDTAGQYLLLKGVPAPTQYSASTGGYTVTSQFPAVVDAGDSVCIPSSYWTCNPDHSWTTTVPVKTVQADFPQIGTLTSITVTARSGCDCSWGGHAVEVKISGSKSSLTEPAYDFQSQFGLMSTWFLIAHPKTTSTRTSTLSPATARTSLPPSGLGGAGTGPLPLKGHLVAAGELAITMRSH